MHESSVRRLQREVKYNRVLLDLLAQLQVPHLLYYGPQGRTIKVIANKMSVLITLEPLPDGMVAVHMQHGVSKPLTERHKEQLLRQKLRQVLNILEG